MLTTVHLILATIAITGVAALFLSCALVGLWLPADSEYR